jgi:CDP-glucose 4,6-dehydratase
MGIDKEFWQGKKVLVTGHTGFKGGWLSTILTMLQADVSGLALSPDSEPNLFQSARINEGMTSYIGDIRDLQLVKNVIEEVRPEIVFHLAAQSLVRESYLQPVETFSTNVLGTVHLLDVVRNNDSVRAFVCVTSDKCYENNGTVWSYKETEPMGGHDPYSASKGCAELAITAMRESFFENESCNIASARAGNVFGGGDWARDRLIPDLILAFAEGKQGLLRNPDYIRPWQHVLDPLSGYMMLAQGLWNEGEKYAEGWNFGPDQDSEISVSEIADQLVRIWDNDSSWASIDSKERHMKEANYLKLDCSKTKQKLGWKPRWNLEQGLKKTTDWYKAFLNGKDMHEYTQQQISTYMQ